LKRTFFADIKPFEIFEEGFYRYKFLSIQKKGSMP
jgi:hypothetical protein